MSKQRAHLRFSEARIADHEHVRIAACEKLLPLANVLGRGGAIGGGIQIENE